MILALAEAVKNTSSAMEKTLSGKQLSHYIDYTILNPDTTFADVENICKEAVELQVYGVCIPPLLVKKTREFLKGQKVKTITVCGFPFGFSAINAKVEEAKKAISDRVHEIDMVMNVSSFKSGNFQHVKQDIQSVSTVCRLSNKLIKVIIETSYLSDDEIKSACEICAEAEVDFVKTSTGFSSAGAKTEHIRLMRESLPKTVKIKASGGIKDRAFALELLEAGADRIGTSSARKILEL